VAAVQRTKAIPTAADELLPPSGRDPLNPPAGNPSEGGECSQGLFAEGLRLCSQVGRRTNVRGEFGDPASQVAHEVGRFVQMTGDVDRTPSSDGARGRRMVNLGALAASQDIDQLIHRIGHPAGLTGAGQNAKRPRIL
jgi:hypothetical protein